MSLVARYKEPAGVPKVLIWPFEFVAVHLNLICDPAHETLLLEVKITGPTVAEPDFNTVMLPTGMVKIGWQTCVYLGAAVLKAKLQVKFFVSPPFELQV
jgi:hypothetical protein